MILVNVLQDSKPILQDIANRAWASGDTDLFSTARMVLAVRTPPIGRGE